MGTSAAEAKDRALASLYDTWMHRHNGPVLALAEDGSLFLGYCTGEDTVSLEHHNIDTATGLLHRGCSYSDLLNKDHTAEDFGTYQFRSVADAVKHYVTRWNRQFPRKPHEPSTALPNDARPTPKDSPES